MNKIALITGASRGIGACVARRLAEEGYDLILVSLKAIENLQSIKKELEADCKVNCRISLCDVSDPKMVEELFLTIDKLDVLVNNAGIAYSGLLSQMSTEEWHTVINTNLSAVFYTCRQTIPLMLQHKRGRIINISSVWGDHGASMEAAYSASKGGLDGLTKALGKELAPSGISVNAIACGVIDTEMNNCYSEEEKERLREEIPADRFGRTQEVAQLVWQLVDAPEYLTAQVITLDGGWQ